MFRRCAVLLPEDPAPFINLSTALLVLGDERAALDAARRACRRAPNLPQAHYTLGRARLACADLDRAAEAFGAALRLDANFADAWVNLGLICYRRSDLEGAKAAMRRALAVVPGHRGAAGNLGVFMRLTGESDAGEALLREALARDPGAAEVRLNLAANLLQEERAVEALALLEAVPLPSEPRMAQYWQAQRVLALIQSGRLAEARHILEAIPGGRLGTEPSSELAPLLLWRRTLLALAAGHAAEAQALAGQMERRLSGDGIVPEHCIMGHFDLAKFWSGQGAPDRAFPHWVEGHRLLGRLQPFSREGHRQFVDTTIRCFDHQCLRDRVRGANADPAPIFVVGMPRSGTTLAEQIIAAHPQVHGAGERSALPECFYRLGGGWGPPAVEAVAVLDRTSLDNAAAVYLAELHGLAPAALRVVDKMPGNFNYLGLVARMLPGARVIYCARDPRDIGLSIFTFRFYGYHPYAHDLADLGWYIAEHERLMAHWRDVLPNPLLTVQLKDWVEDFAGTLRRVLDFLDLPYDAACERFYDRDTRVRTVSRSQVRQPINARGLGRWRAYERHLQPLLAELEKSGMLPLR
jgi:tetratricopeptide (TPR) repeat protein